MGFEMDVDKPQKGSLELKNAMPYGSIQKIAETFNVTASWVSQVLEGKRKGNTLMIECAYQVLDLYDAFNDDLDVILKNYK